MKKEGSQEGGVSHRSVERTMSYSFYAQNPRRTTLHVGAKQPALRANYVAFSLHRDSPGESVEHMNERVCLCHRVDVVTCL